MWPAILALTALLQVQAGGVTAGRSCEPGSRNAVTIALPRAADVGRAIVRGAVGAEVPASRAAQEIGVDR